MATKQNITVNSHFPLCPTITHRLLLPLTFSISFILCYGVSIDAKNVIHTVNNINVNGYVNSYRSKSGVTKSPKLRIKTRSDRMRVRHI
jgi:hypothetical protein